MVRDKVEWISARQLHTAGLCSWSLVHPTRPINPKCWNPKIANCKWTNSQLA